MQKTARQRLGKVLTQLFDALLLEGYFPTEWKVAQHPHLKARKTS
jgi:hypothetical protein